MLVNSEKTPTMRHLLGQHRIDTPGRSQVSVEPGVHPNNAGVKSLSEAMTRSVSAVQTEPASPYSVALAISTASSSV